MKKLVDARDDGVTGEEEAEHLIIDDENLIESGSTSSVTSTAFPPFSSLVQHKVPLPRSTGYKNVKFPRES